MHSSHQMIAYGDPCFEAEETTKEKFRWRLSPPMDHVTVVLTATIGLE